MTRAELQAIIDDVNVKKNAVRTALRSVDGVVSTVEQAIRVTPFDSAVTLNIDQIVTIHTPLYIQALTLLETATDALGTDPLH